MYSKKSKFKELDKDKKTNKYSIKKMIDKINQLKFDNVQLQEDIFDMVIQTVNFPTLYVSQSSHQVMNTIERHTAKLNVDDEVRSRAVMEHYAEHIDVELLLERVDGNQAAMRDFGCPR